MSKKRKSKRKDKGAKEKPSPFQKVTRRLEQYESAVAAHNAKMAKVPALDKAPANVVDALRVLADWFDALYQDAGTGRSG